MRYRLAALLRANSSNGVSFGKRSLVTTRPQCKSRISVASLLDATERSRPTQEESIAVPGYVQTIRKQKKVAFAAIRDGSSLKPLQAVMKPEHAEE